MFFVNSYAVPSLRYDTGVVPAAVRALDRLYSKYAGAAVCVRRDTDSERRDIGFTQNRLDVAAIEEFAGSGKAWVMVWYDQVGDDDLVYPVATQQPVISIDGNVVRDGGVPAVLFPDGSMKSEVVR